MGRLSESPSIIGQIVPLGEVPNQTMFIYARIVDPVLTISNQTYEGYFNNDMKYLSPCSRKFVLKYFNKCNWQGWRLGWYE